MNQMYMQQSLPQQVTPGMGYYGNMGMQTSPMYGAMPMTMAGNQMGMTAGSMNMLGNGIAQMNLSSNAGMMSRGGMMGTGSVNMQQTGLVGGGQNYGRVMQFK